MGIIRAGAVVFPIANGNSAPAIASLLRARKVAALIVDPDGQAPELAATLERALAEVKADDPQHEIKRIVMPPWDDMFSPKHLDAPFLPPMPVLPMDALILTLHSSGTTAFPKPVDLSLHSWLCASRARNWLSMPFGGRRTFLGAMPPYHALGVLLSQSVTMTAGSTVALSPPSQAWVSLLREASESAVLTVSCVPAALAGDHPQDNGAAQIGRDSRRAHLLAALGAGRPRYRGAQADGLGGLRRRAVERGRSESLVSRFSRHLLSVHRRATSSPSVAFGWRTSTARRRPWSSPSCELADTLA
jgi:acyl-CoA synthetase (AMP-forming)/AMP-acid ligase II